MLFLGKNAILDKRSAKLDKVEGCHTLLNSRLIHLVIKPF